MHTILLIVAFLALAGLFVGGAQHSLRNPRQTDREIDSYTTNAVYDLGQALMVGGIILAIGLMVVTR